MQQNQFFFENQSRNLKKIESGKKINPKRDTPKSVTGQSYAIRIDKNRENIKQFPRKSRIALSFYIYKLLNKKPEITNGLIIEKIFLNIENSSKIKVIPLSERKEIKEKRKNRDFKKAIHKYFLELIEIIRELRNLNIQKKKYAQQGFVNELISQGITLGLSPTYLKEFIKELVKELQNKFDDFNLKGITTRWTYEDLQKLAQKKRGKLLNTREEFESIKTPPSHTIFLWEGKMVINLN